MRVNLNNSQVFEGKKFRIPVKIVKPTDSISHKMSSYGKNTQIPGNFVKEYSNPKAEEYFIKAQNAKSVDEMLKYLDAMGDFKIIDIENEKRVNKFLNNLNVLG